MSVQNVDPWAEAGILIRETLNSNSKKVASLVTVANGVTFQRRSTTGGSTYYSRTTGVAAPYWIPPGAVGQHLYRLPVGKQHDLDVDGLSKLSRWGPTSTSGWRSRLTVTAR